jgi:hypothetical protein
MITFKQQFTFNEEAVKGFALHLGWTEKVTEQEIVVDDDTTDPVTTHTEQVEVDNPVTFIEFVKEKAREHSLQFTKGWANTLVESEITKQKSELEETLRPQLEQAIVKPVEDALEDEVITK